MAGTQDPTRRNMAAGLLVSAAAVALALTHAALPTVPIDWVTVALVVIALLPWVAPLFKTIELGPGGVKLETRLREVQEHLHRESQRVEELANRVERVEDVVFSGLVTPQLASELSKALHSFQDFLASLGFDVEPFPQIHVGDSAVDAAEYDARNNRVTVGVAVAGDPDVVCKSYIHQVLFDAVPGSSFDSERLRALESGLGDYFVCSHGGNPRLGHRSGAVWSARQGPDHPYIRALDHHRGFNELASDATHWDIGEVWGAAFWELRVLLGQSTADRALAAAWRGLRDAAPGDPIDRFVARLEQLTGAGAVTVKEVFRRRGAEQAIPGPPA